jgi:hypothetical protein
MSALLMGRVFYTDLSAHLRFTLLALADHADDEGANVYPGQDRLARKVGASVRSVRDHLHELERLGYLAVVRRHGPHGTTVYRIAVAKLPTEPTLDRQPTAGPERLDRQPVAGVDRQPTADRQKLPTGSPASPATVSTGSPASVDRQPTADNPSGTIRKKKQPSRRGRARETDWPDDFVLTDERRARARAVGCRNPELAWEHWHQRCLAKGLRYARWGAAWVTWLANHARYGCPCREPPPARRGQSVRDMARDIAAEWAAETGGTGP